MQTNEITIQIHRPIGEVFEFTTNPNNTYLWIPSIHQEIAEEFPPKIGTRYKNRGEKADWDFYKVTQYELDRLFALSDLDGNYHVKYTYKKLDDGQTEMTYLEWMKSGELEKPFTEAILQNLKQCLEKV